MSSTLSLPKKAINKKGPIDERYVAVFKEEQIELYARSLNAARQTAVEHFKPKKKETQLVVVFPKVGLTV